MSIKDDAEKMSAEEIEKLRERFKRDPKDAQTTKEFIEMNEALHEASEMSEGESFSRGMINMILGIFGNDERAKMAKARGMGFMNEYMFRKASEGRLDEKLKVSPQEITKAFNEEMEKRSAPLVAQEDGDEIKVSTWDADEGDEQ